MEDFDKGLEKIMKEFHELTKDMTYEELRDAMGKEEIPSELLGKVGIRVAGFVSETKEKYGVNLDSEACTKIAFEIAGDILDYEMDERWAEHFQMAYSPEHEFEGEKYEPEIHVSVGQRDIQFGVDGEHHGGGFCFLPATPPWEKKEEQGE
jgi:hypothetical protein